MAERITNKDVVSTFETFVDVASRAGFDTTGWALQTRNPYRGYALYIYKDHTYGNHPMTSYIGSTAREAWNWLSASITTMGALERLHTS